jgi:hypothetical protein
MSKRSNRLAWILISRATAGMGTPRQSRITFSPSEMTSGDSFAIKWSSDSCKASPWAFDRAATDKAAVVGRRRFGVAVGPLHALSLVLRLRGLLALVGGLLSPPPSFLGSTLLGLAFGLPGRLLFCNQALSLVGSDPARLDPPRTRPPDSRLRASHATTWTQSPGSRLNWSGLSQLKLRWGVSKAAILIRGRQLGLFSDDQVRAGYIGLNRHGDPLHVRVDRKSDPDNLPLTWPNRRARAEAMRWRGRKKSGSAQSGSHTRSSTQGILPA